MTYKIVDLRPILPGSPVADQGQKPKSKGVVIHYNGAESGATGVPSGYSTSKEIFVGAANRHRTIDWGTPPQKVFTNGIQYHYGVWEDTVFVLRNPNSCLWHCNDWKNEDYAWNHSYNYNATAVNVPISFNERATARTLQTLREFVDDELRKQGHANRSQVRGHKEISASLCPHSLMDDFVKPYRSDKSPLAGSGGLILGDGVPPAKKYYAVYGNAFDERVADSYAKALMEHGIPAGRVGSFGVPSKPNRDGEADVRWISKQALKQPLGTYPTAFCGSPILAYVPDAVQKAFRNPSGGWFATAQSDLWDAIGKDAKDTQEKAAKLLKVVAGREGKNPNKVISSYYAILAKKPMPDLAKPAVDDKPSAKRRGPDDLFGKPRVTKKQALAFAAKRKANMARAKEMADAMYSVKGLKTTWAADVRFGRALLETGNFHYGHDSVWPNPSGIKKSAKERGGPVGDDPIDFLVPASAAEGAHVDANHCRAYSLKDALPPVHGRYADAYAAQKARGWALTKISQLGGGIWATDPHYAAKIRAIMDEMDGGSVKDDLAVRVDKAMAYGLSLVGKPYGTWWDGGIPKKEPAFAENGPPPPASSVKNIFCVGVQNLMRRSVGLPIPRIGVDPYAGGTGGWGRWIDEHADRSEKFDINKQYPRGTMIFRYFRNNQDQGHGAVCLGNGYLLQSYCVNLGSPYPGVTTDVRIDHSHAGWFYERAVLPKAWLGG